MIYKILFSTLFVLSAIQGYFLYDLATRSDITVKQTELNTQNIKIIVDFINKAIEEAKK